MSYTSPLRRSYTVQIHRKSGWGEVATDSIGSANSCGLSTLGNFQSRIEAARHGYVCGHEEEWGYFLLSELESVRGPAGLTAVRDLHFKSEPFSHVLEQYHCERGQE